jgi:hypothetical protein
MHVEKLQLFLLEFQETQAMFGQVALFVTWLIIDKNVG